MDDQEPPRRLRERSEKHYCVRCLRDVEKDEYLENDFLCDACIVIVQEGMKGEG